MAIFFKGVQQVTRAKFETVAKADKLGWFWLVTNDASANTEYDIYFGSRLYGSNIEKLETQVEGINGNVAELSTFANNVKTVFAELMDEEGAFILPIKEGQEEPFLSIDVTNVDNLFDLLQAFDKAIGNALVKSDLQGYYTKDEIDSKITPLQTAIQSCLTGAQITVGDDVYSGTVSNGVVNIDLTDAFAAAGKVQDVQVDDASVVEDGVAKISLSGKANVDIVNAIADRVASLEGIAHAADVVYDSTAQTIYLVDDSGNTIGKGFDASDFVVDGMLESVEPKEGSNGIFVFTFNVDGEDGKNKTIEVDFSRFIDVYSGSTTSAATVSVTNNVISVDSVKSEGVQVSTIPVGGTPLADILTKNNITAITANNLQAVLESLFSQNLWAENPRRNVPTSLGVSMSAPTISLDKTGTQEVGTTVYLSASAKTATASASITYSGFTYGYSLENDNTKDGDTPASVTISGTKVTDSNYKLSFVTNSGFGGTDVADVTGQSTSGNSLVVAQGTNKVTVTATAPSFTATVPAQNKIYACSSLKKTDEEHVVSATTATTINSTTKTSTGSTSVTGDYYAFIGYSDTLPTTNDEYRAFIGNGLTHLSKGGNLSGVCNKTYFVICIPADWSFTCKHSTGNDITASFSDTGDVTITLPNGDTKAYKYYAQTYNGGEFKELIIK